MDVDAGGQGNLIGYASDETMDRMPPSHSIANRFGKKLTDVKNGDLWCLRPDGKTKVTFEYMQTSDVLVVPQKIHTVVISTLHAEPPKAVRTKGCSHQGYSGPEMTAPSIEEMNKHFVEKIGKLPIALSTAPPSSFSSSSSSSSCLVAHVRNRRVKSGLHPSDSLEFAA